MWERLEAAGARWLAEAEEGRLLPGAGGAVAEIKGKGVMQLFFQSRSQAFLTQ